MPRCEDAPCCGCCGYTLDRADYDAQLERAAYDDPYYDDF